MALAYLHHFENLPSVSVRRIIKLFVVHALEYVVGKELSLISHDLYLS